MSDLQSGGPLTDERVRELATEILAGPPFDRWRAPDIQLIEQLARFIDEYVQWLHDLQLSAPGLFWLLLLGMLVVCLGLLAHIVWSLRVALSAPAPRATARAGVERPRWSEEAERLAASGDFLEATHRLALGSVETLIENEHIELGRFETNRVLRERVRAAALPGAVASEFLRLLDAFEQQWFRDRDDDPQLYHAWRELHGRLSALRGEAR